MGIDHNPGDDDPFRGVATGLSQDLAEALTDFQRGQQAWSEHLFYDMRMLYQTAALWRRREQLRRDLPEQLGKAMENALIESFQVHERNLAEFFRKKARERSFQLSRFLEASAERKWRQRHLDDNADARLDEIWDRASTHLAHMSHERTHDQSPESPKHFDIEADVAFLDPIIKAFVGDRVIASKLSRRVNWQQVDSPEARPVV